MKEYICEKCDKVFDRKSNYETHINKKKTCNIKLKKSPNNTENLLLNDKNLLKNSENLPKINVDISNNDDTGSNMNKKSIQF